MPTSPGISFKSESEARVAFVRNVLFSKRTGDRENLCTRGWFCDPGSGDVYEWSERRQGVFTLMKKITSTATFLDDDKE